MQYLLVDGMRTNEFQEHLRGRLITHLANMHYTAGARELHSDDRIGVSHAGECNQRMHVCVRGCQIAIPTLGASPQ